MNIKINDIKGIILKTKDKFVKEDITIMVDESFVQPQGTLEITEKGEYDVKEIEKVNVNIESGSGTDMLQARVDATNSCAYLFSEYTGTNVDFISNLDMSNVTSTNYMFENCTALMSIPPLDISNVTSTDYMFYECQALTSIPPLNTSNVKSGSKMFYNCVNLESVPSFDTSNMTNLNSMFYGCAKLKSVPPLNTSKVTAGGMASIVRKCSSLEKVDISHYYSPNASNSGYICNSCYSLKAVIFRNFYDTYYLIANTFIKCYHILGTVDETYNPTGAKDGYIYVPRNMVDTLKSATNWSAYADQIRPLEDYTVDGTTTGELDLEKMGITEE